MNELKNQLIELRLKYLPSFADYLLSQRLDDFVRSLYRIGVQLDIPLLRFFSGMSEDEILRLSRDGNLRLLSAIKQNTIADYIEYSKTNWLKNQLPIITRTDVVAEDISLINFARKRAFREYIKSYTTDHDLALDIVDEIDQFILSLESVLFKTFLSIQQEKLQESNEKLIKREAELLEAQDLGKIGSFEWDLTGANNSSYTPEVFKIFEMEQTSNLEEFLNDVHPEDQLKVRAALEKAVHDGMYECEYRYHRNGKFKVLSSRGRVFFDKGRPLRMVGTVTDITEKASLIAKLTENEELSKQAQALTNTGNWKWSIDADVIEWSDEMYRIYGLEPQAEKITFQRFLTFIDDEDRNRRIAEITEAVKTGVAADYVMRINSLDGRQKVLKGKGRVLKDKFGKSIGMLGTCQDITNEYSLTNQLKRKNEELQRKNKELESFNFIASHDLQEPLRKIQTFSSRITHEGKDSIPEHLMHYFNKITQSSNRMQKMIEDFLVFYHSLNSVDDDEIVSLEEVVSQAWASLSEGANKRQAQLTIEPLPSVKGRRLRLKQVFRHLLSNAVKFAKQDVPLLIRIQASSYRSESGADYIMVSVSDNGIGFDQKYADRVFEIFQKLHSQDEYPGSGIGLSLCKKIVEDHGGWVSVTSQAQVGSTFNVFIPGR
ncbi:MAG TPA: ATP-binding protein [Chryseosolibacter sp.]